MPEPGMECGCPELVPFRGQDKCFLIASKHSDRGAKGQHGGVLFPVSLLPYRNALTTLGSIQAFPHKPPPCRNHAPGRKGPPKSHKSQGSKATSPREERMMHKDQAPLEREARMCALVTGPSHSSQPQELCNWEESVGCCMGSLAACQTEKQRGKNPQNNGYSFISPCLTRRVVDF